MLKSILLGIIVLIATPAFCKTVTVDPLRTVQIVGPIYGNGLDYAQQIEAISNTDSKEPIHIVINSPGGSVVTGSQILSAMAIAQSRGITIKCYVPVLAASMGFQVLIHCDERYALKYALLLFHPMAITTNASLTADSLLYHGRRLRAWEKPFIKDLLKVLKIEPKLFLYHYRNETLWMGFEFRKLSPGFLEIVSDIQGVDGLFNVR